MRSSGEVVARSSEDITLCQQNSETSAMDSVENYQEPVSNSSIGLLPSSFRNILHESVKPGSALLNCQQDTPTFSSRQDILRVFMFRSCRLASTLLALRAN